MTEDKNCIPLDHLHQTQSNTFSTDLSLSQRRHHIPITALSLRKGLPIKNFGSLRWGQDDDIVCANDIQDIELTSHVVQTLKFARIRSGLVESWTSATSLLIFVNHFSLFLITFHFCSLLFTFAHHLSLFLITFSNHFSLFHHFFITFLSLLISWQNTWLRLFCCRESECAVYIYTKPSNVRSRTIFRGLVRKRKLLLQFQCHLPLISGLRFELPWFQMWRLDLFKWPNKVVPSLTETNIDEGGQQWGVLVCATYVRLFN